jgi:tetratricopeptide (TPR) repeat protein
MAILVLFSPLLRADTGETSAGFLNLGVDASVLGMGSAAIALGDGVHSLFWNPAGLGVLDGTEATLMHAEHFQSIRHENLGIAHSLNSLNIGFSIKGLYVGGMEERTGPSAEPISMFSAAFLAPSLSAAKALTPDLSLGTTVKFVYQQISEDNAISFGSDIGATNKFGMSGFRAGIALANAGTKAKFGNSSYSLPAQLRTGFGYSSLNGGLSIALDVVKPFTDGFEFHIGAEGMIVQQLFLRAGYNSGLNDGGGLAGTALGLGLKIKNIDIDYAVNMYGVLGLTHNFSVSYIFGRAKYADTKGEQLIAQELQKRARLTAETFYQQGLMQQSGGNYEDALRNFDIALIWDPLYNDAIRAADETRTQLNTQRINSHLNLGIKAFNSVNYIDAIAEFGYALDIEPDNATAKAWLKAATDALVKVQMEKSKFTKDIENKITGYYEKALEHFARKEYPEAIAQWNKVLALDPAHSEARAYVEKAQIKIAEQIRESSRLIDTYVTQGKWIQALDEVNRILLFEPGNQQAVAKKDEIKKSLRNLSKDHTAKGIKLYKQGQYGQAETEFKVALNYYASNITANDYLNKIRSVRKESKGEDINVLYMKGVTAYTQENYQMAVFYWNRVLEIDSSHLNAQRNIKRAQEKLKIKSN